MNWKLQLEKYEFEKNWKSAIELMQRIILENPNDVEAYIRTIYLLHNILVEEDYPDSELQIETLLKDYFDKSYQIFQNNAEYLFFIGKILYIAEWYFGLNDDLKPMEEKLAFKMEKKASELEPRNTLYEWAWRFSISDNLAGYIAEQIILNDQKSIYWLKSKGFPGKCILENLEYSKGKYGNNLTKRIN